MLRYLKDVLCAENTSSRVVEAAEKLQLQAVNLAQKPVILMPHHHQPTCFTRLLTKQLCFTKEGNTEL